MQFRRNLNSNLSLPILAKAQQTLLSPQEFYELCQQVKQLQHPKKLYFVLDNSLKFKDKIAGLNLQNILVFFDYLAEKINKCNQENLKLEVYLHRVLIKYKKGGNYGLTPKLIVKKYWTKNAIKLSVEIVGKGMIGRVAKVRINDGEDLALKVFFDSSLVWQHGPWAEIPAAIYLQAHQVTKNIPEFKFAGQTWAVWEWIYPETTPESRPGITYEEFASQQGLTALNYLNRKNYNPNQIRLDLGGIQKEYVGRRWHDFITSIIFYFRKFRQEGFLFLKDYLTWKNLVYFSLRLFVLVVSYIIKPKFSKGFRSKWIFLKASK